MLDDREIFTSTAGWSEEENGPDYNPLQIPLESAICPHMMTKTNENAKNACFVMDDAKEDWRFAKNVGEPGNFARFDATANSLRYSRMFEMAELYPSLPLPTSTCQRLLRLETAVNPPSFQSALFV